MDRRERIAALIREELQGLPQETHDPSLGMPLQVLPYGADEVIAAVGLADCLPAQPRESGTSANASKTPRRPSKEDRAEFVIPCTCACRLVVSSHERLGLASSSFKEPSASAALVKSSPPRSAPRTNT